MKGINVSGLKERLPGRNQMSRGGGPKIENPILRAAVSAFVLAFLCAAFACLIVYRQSTQRVSEVRFDHLRASGSILEKSINLAQHERIQDSGDASGSAYQSILRSLRKVVKGDPDVRYATTFRWTNGKITYVVDSAGPYEIIQGKKTRGPAIGEVYKEASSKLKECFRTRKPTHDNSPVTNERGTFISAYVPMENSKGKVVAVVALDMKYSEYKKDFEALQGALQSGLIYSFFFSMFIGAVTAFITWRSGRRTLELSHEVVQTAQKLNRTESELVHALEASKDLSSSLVKTLLTAGCLIWTGSASTKTGKLVWVGELKYDPGFDWLTPLLKINAKFEDVWASLRSAEDQANWERILSFTIGSRLESTVMEYQLHLPGGKSIWFEEQLTLKYEEDGSVNIDAFVQDVSDQKSRTQEVFRLAYYDTVTGLINRTRIHQVINEFLVDRPRVCLIGIEISNFRNINESWGAEIGDKVLKDLATTLSEGIGQQGIVGRLAGDDFVVIVPDESILSLLVGRIDDLCQRPTVIDGIEVAKVCRLGYAPAEQNESAVSLIRKANLALEYARKNQSPYPVAYKAEMSFRAKMRVELETSMRQALMDREFYLMFQPIYCNKTQRLVKAEALLRWNSSRFGPVSPGTFIPIAEESDFINDIGNFVVDETGKAIHKLEQMTGRTDIVISVNLSLQQLKNQATLNLFNSVIDRWTISPKNMLIEITESSIMHDSNECDVMLNKLQERGFSLAIDDFGTGYSSLATLASLPFDTLKIDKRFVDGIGVDRKQEEVISTIIRLARALNLQIVAEGIEQEPQFDFLRDRDVEYSQGYYFSKPIPFEDLVELAKKAHFRAA